MEKYTYLFLHLFTISYPLAQSFERRIQYYTKWKALLVAALPTAAFFLIWDYFFTQWGVWSFNPKYVIGIYILGMPIEEWMFFFTIPFACVFIYECVLYFVKKDPLYRVSGYISLLIIVSNFALAVAFYDRWYTVFNLSANAFFLSLHLYTYGTKHLGKFYIAYVFALIGFAIVNGILTYLPVVMYNDAENLGIRIGSIPIEDSMYAMLLLMMYVSIYEWAKNKFEQKNKIKSSTIGNSNPIRYAQSSS